jgi:hypothetical protein
MDAADVWVAKDDETEIIRAREIAAVNLDYDGNVTARLAGGDAALVTLQPAGEAHAWPVYEQPDLFLRLGQLVVTQHVEACRVAPSGGKHRFRPGPAHLSD